PLFLLCPYTTPFRSHRTPRFLGRAAVTSAAAQTARQPPSPLPRDGSASAGTHASILRILPVWRIRRLFAGLRPDVRCRNAKFRRSEEHTAELQSPFA